MDSRLLPISRQAVLLLAVFTVAASASSSGSVGRNCRSEREPSPIRPAPPCLT